MQIQISWLLQKPTDLDLHCLQRQSISGLSRTRVKVAGYTWKVFQPFCKGRQLLQTGSCLSCIWNFSKMRLILRERISSQRKPPLHNPHEKGGNIPNPQLYPLEMLFPLEVCPFSLKYTVCATLSKDAHKGRFQWESTRYVMVKTAKYYPKLSLPLSPYLDLCLKYHTFFFFFFFFLYWGFSAQSFWSCWVWSLYLTTLLLGRLRPLSS